MGLLGSCLTKDMETTSPPVPKWSAYVVASAISFVLIAFFGWSLPDMLKRGREGLRKTKEAPCQALAPTAMTKLGRVPLPAPDFALKTHDGKEVRLSALRGRVVLVNFWATWCPPCLEEEPSLTQLAKAMKDRDFSILAVSVDTDWEVVRSHFPKGSPMTVLLNSDRSVPASFGTEKFPESFLIDREGNIRYFIVSTRENWHGPEAKACIDALLSE